MSFAETEGCSAIFAARPAVIPHFLASKNLTAFAGVQLNTTIRDDGLTCLANNSVFTNQAQSFWATTGNAGSVAAVFKNSGFAKPLSWDFKAKIFGTRYSPTSKHNA